MLGGRANGCYFSDLALLLDINLKMILKLIPLKIRCDIEHLQYYKNKKILVINSDCKEIIN